MVRGSQSKGRHVCFSERARNGRWHSHHATLCAALSVRALHVFPLCAAVAIFQMGRWSQRRQVKCPDQVHVDGRVGTGHGFHKLSLFGDVRPTTEAGQALSSRELSPEAARAARGRVFSRGRARAARRHAAAAFCSVCQMSSNERRRQARQKSEKASRRCHLTSGS